MIEQTGPGQGGRCGARRSWTSTCGRAPMPSSASRSCSAGIAQQLKALIPPLLEKWQAGSGRRGGRLGHQEDEDQVGGCNSRGPAHLAQPGTGQETSRHAWSTSSSTSWCTCWSGTTTIASGPDGQAHAPVAFHREELNRSPLGHETWRY